MKHANTNIAPLVSVLLVTYNHEQFIHRVIDGVLMQRTAFPFELVIGEDASTDRTAVICEEYAAKYPGKIRFLHSEQNVGLNENFLRTFSACKGKYIAYLEGDDWWITEDKLQKQVDILESYRDVVLVHTNCQLFDLNTNQRYSHFIQFPGDCIRELHAGMAGVVAEFEGHFRPMKTSTICYRRNIMVEILESDLYLFSNPDFPTQDFQLFQEMCLRGKFAFINEDTTLINFHDSISAPKDELKRVNFRFGFFKIGIYLIDKYKLPQKTVDKWIRKELYFFFQDALFRKESTVLLKALSDALSRGYKLPVTQRLKYFYIKYLMRISR